MLSSSLKCTQNDRLTDTLEIENGGLAHLPDASPPRGIGWGGKVRIVTNRRAKWGGKNDDHLQDMRWQQPPGEAQGARCKGRGARGDVVQGQPARRGARGGACCPAIVHSSGHLPACAGWAFMAPPGEGRMRSTVHKGVTSRCRYRLT